MPNMQTSTRLVPHLYLLLAAVVFLFLLSYTFDIFLLVFAGILLAIVISSSGRLLNRYIGLSEVLAISFALIILVLVFTGLIFIIAPAVSKQTAQLYSDLPEAWNKLITTVLGFLNLSDGAGTGTSEDISVQNALLKIKDVPSKLGGIFTSTFGFIGNMIVILFFGITLAYQPMIYVRGLVCLFPKERQDKVKEILHDTHETLKNWLLGKAFSMLVVGLLTWLGLWLLGIPLAFTLALLAAFLSFIPNIGPIIAAIPAVLLALLVNPVFALYTVILYLLIQTVESYLITPFVQQKAVLLPPALIVFMQLIMSLLAGILGLALATPLLAAITVVVKRTYLAERLQQIKPNLHKRKAKDL